MGINLAPSRIEKHPERMSSEAEPNLSLGSRVILSIKATFTAWAVFVVLLLAMALVGAVTNPHAFANGSNPFAALLLVAIGSAVVVFCVWLVAVLPITLLIPQRSILWEPQYLTIIGALAGPIIVLLGGIYQIEANPTIQPRSAYLLSGIVFPGVPSAIIGGITGAAASYFHKRLTEKKREATGA